MTCHIMVGVTLIGHKADMLACSLFVTSTLYMCFQKTATAVAHCKQGKGLIKINGRPTKEIEPRILREKVCESSMWAGACNGCCEDGDFACRW